MKIEIDTSSRLDQSGDTVFAFLNDIQKAILLKQKVRNECLNRLKGKKLTKELRLFAGCVYLLIKDHVNKIDEIKINIEYPSHENRIKMLTLFLIFANL